MIVCLRTWGVWCLAVQLLLVEAEVTLQNGAYRDLVVSFSSNLPAEDGKNVVNSMKVLLENTSTVLHNAIGIPIGHVTFVLPDAWDVSDWDPAPGTAPPFQPDILVGHGEGSPFGKAPFARQFGGCGVPGTHIDVPYNFLSASQDEYPKEKLLAREWLKFRYGVFDENGFPGDPMYPDHFTVPGDQVNVHVTECTDPAVEYEFRSNSSNEICSLGQGTCKIQIRSGGDEVKSSLMYFHEDLKNVEHVCGEDYEHNTLGPSKQNLLCREKGIWKVLKESPDFKESNTAQSTTPEFHYVKISKPKVYIVLENTDLLKEKKEEVLFALRRVVFDLPEGSHFGLSTFSLDNKVTEVRPLSELTEDRNIFISPDFEAPPQNLCPLCALEKAVDEFSPEEQGLVILITASNLTNPDNTPVIEKLKNSRLLLVLMTITDPDAPLDSYNDLLEQLEDKAHLEDMTSSKIDLFQALYMKITSYIPYSESPKEVAVAYKTISQTDNIEIPQNSFAEKFTIWTGTSFEDSKLNCNDGEDSIVLSKDTKVNSIGKFTFNSKKSVKCHVNYGSSIMTQVTITSTPGKILSANAWVHDTTPKDQPTESKEQMPVIIYAKIDYWGYPVFDAQVTAVVTVDGGNQINVDLKDNGKGDPDITLRDGIYSGYFYEFIKEGYYDVKVEMKSNEISATALKNGNDRCCGSQVNPTEPLEDSTVEVPSFQIYTTTKFKAIGAKPEKGYPPSRILDLRVTKFEPPSLLELSWTAPERTDQANALRYILKSFANRQNALDRFNSTEQELDIDNKTPSAPGTRESATLQLDGLLSDNTTHYLTLLAIGSAGPGQPSNVVTVAVPEAPAPTEEPPPPTSDPKEASGPNKTTIAIVIGVLVGVIVVAACLYLVVYCLGKRKRRAKRDEEARKPEEVRNGGGLGMNSIPADVILRHHSEVVRAKMDHKDPPIFTEEAAEAPSTQSTEEPAADTEQESPPATLPPKSPKRMTVV